MPREYEGIAKNIMSFFRCKVFVPRINCTCKKERFGSDYGGWDVAIDQVNGQSIVYSFGIGEDTSFDIELIKRFNVVIHAFDPTPKSIEWLKKQALPENFIYHEYGLADFDGNIQFYPPKNPNHTSFSILEQDSSKRSYTVGDVKKLRTIMNELGHNKIDILKMDIEGAEYLAIEDMIKSKIVPTQILVEFHHRFPNVGLDKTKKCINLLRESGYYLYSVSSSKEEFCFIHKDFIS